MSKATRAARAGADSPTAVTPTASESPADIERLDYLAQAYGVSEETVRRWIRTGAIPYALVGASRVRRISAAPIGTPLRPQGHAD